MENCIFCEIIHKKVEAYIIYENEHVCCFLDKSPINIGHILIVPKTHSPEFRDVDEKSLNEVINTAQKMARVLENLFPTDGITVLQENGIFKDVEHYHMHVIPRYKDDGFYLVEPENAEKPTDFMELKIKMQAYLHKEVI
ncbi:HIT family protein [Sporosarcina sp. D27]|uniref:HIT family protein n=1 Tax=Sporosarcina sp. D27 TaxID=1382305 RepID=UPI00047186FB|nr:HIT family protein [Sporosarcina sp. D27]